MRVADDTKERLISAAAELMRERDDCDGITVKDIAERAGTSVGLVNYHFASRDNLLSIAAARIWDPFGREWERLRKAKNPAEFKRRLTLALQALGDMIADQTNAARVTVESELIKGSFETTRFLALLIRDAIPAYGERDARLAAWLIVPPLQLALLNMDQFEDFSGVDYAKKAERDRFFSDVVERVLGDIGSKTDEAGPAADSSDGKTGNHSTK